MKIALLDIKKKGDNKDFNGGFGTTFQAGTSLKSKILVFARSNLENLPTISYTYVSAIFKKYGHSVKYFLNEIPFSYDLILIHVSLIRHNEELKYIKKMKEKGIKNIGVYGPLATVRPELFKEVDFVIVGEPEQAAINIAKSNKIPKGIIKTKPIDLNILPFSDWDIFDIREISLSPTIQEKPAVFIHASRGCPYGCSYCPYKIFGNHRIRNPELVVRELIGLKDKFKIKGFYFRDPTFSINRKSTEELANLMIKKELNLVWGCETRTDLLDENFLRLLHKAGLRAIKIGVETLNHQMLGEYKRIPPTMQHQEKIIKICNELGIKVIAFYIIGFPTDTKESIKQTIRYSKKLNTSFANFTIFTPIFGTSYYENLKDKIIDHNLNNFDNFHVVFKHDNLKKEEILKLQEKAITEYYFRAGYIWKYLLDKVKLK